MKKIVILTMGEGHLSIAKAIEQNLQGQYECVLVVYRIPEFDLYLPIYQLFPSLFQVPYKLTEYKSAQKFVRSMMSRRYEKKVMAMLDENKPDLVISTYLLYDKICADYSKDHGIPCINVIANPRTIHPVEACEDSCNIVFDNTAVDTLHTYGIQTEQIQKLGWFVRSQFSPAKDVQLVRKKLGLIPHPTTLLFTAGSDGSSTILKILPLFFQITSPLQAVFICGNNTSLYKSLQVFVKTFRFANRLSPVRFTVLRFVDNIHEYMQASDMVIGKAGPNSIFESVACHIPFFALTHISGQEDGNLELITEYNLGIVEENPIQAISKLKEIASNPTLLTQYKDSVRTMAKYNFESAEKISELISTLLHS